MSGRHTNLQNSGLINTTAGVSTVAGSLILYAVYTSSFKVLSTQILGMFRWLSYVTILAMFLGVFAAVLGIKQVLAAKKIAGQSNFSPPVSVIIANVLSIRKYSRALLSIALAYGIFYAAVSSIIVYRPAENFAVDYLADIPSIVVTVCCGGTGFVPVFTIYLTEHLGLLIIPANIILMILVSSLIGLNASLALHHYNNRPKGADAGWFGRFGAITGFFTACPTCAGLFLGNLFQGVRTVTVASVLATYQPMFVAATLPLLVLSTFLLARGSKHAIHGSCSATTSSPERQE